MKVLLLALLIVGWISLTTASPKYGLPDSVDFKPGHKGFKQAEFTNVLDHFTPSDNRSYQQRFWYSTEDFDHKNGPIFVYICGEYECGVQEERQFPNAVAKEWKALFLYVEHRFYGESQPFDSLSTDNLRYLTSRQALADLAVFITEVNDKIVKDFGGEQRQVLVIGGSYPGALSAWFREKYPHIATASWASSAVVNAIEDFDLFDYQVYNSTTRSNLYCTGTVQNLTIVFDRLVQQGNREEVDKIKASCNAPWLHDFDFAFFFADMVTGAVQYGGRTEICDFLESLAGTNILEQYGKICAHTQDEDSPSDYCRNALRNETIVPSNAGRAWTYQYCTEFGYLQIPYKSVNMRSELLNHTGWIDYCHYIFGDSINILAKDSNIEFGDTHARTSNIYFVNGGEDPWQWAGQLKADPKSNIHSDLLQCENCGHCVELYTEKDSDSKMLKDTRNNIKAWLRKVLRRRSDEEIVS